MSLVIFRYCTFPILPWASSWSVSYPSRKPEFVDTGRVDAFPEYRKTRLSAGVLGVGIAVPLEVEDLAGVALGAAVVSSFLSPVRPWIVLAPYPLLRPPGTPTAGSEAVSGTSLLLPCLGPLETGLPHSPVPRPRCASRGLSGSGPPPPWPREPGSSAAVPACRSTRRPASHPCLPLLPPPSDPPLPQPGFRGFFVFPLYIYKNK